MSGPSAKASKEVDYSKPVVFKKRDRSRLTKPRKRPRASLSEDPVTQLPIKIKKDIKRKKSSWKTELFSAGVEKSPSQHATAQRVDVGGDERPQTAPKKPFGPMRAPAHLRTSVRLDYQPDVCKDYKETGYCGFGDACKFLHDRSDYKAGWQLERDWNEKEKKRRNSSLRGDNADDDEVQSNEKEVYDEDGLPFACFLCREEFKSPVMTLCNHYFCEDCALKRIESISTCPICKTQLRGTLNPAPKLISKLQMKHSG